MTQPELFIVRVWRQIAGGFRASVRRVDDEETRYFTRPEEVTRHLAMLAGPEGGAGEGAGPGATPGQES